MLFQEIIDKRRSIRVFDELVPVAEAVKISLERAVLSPNSSNMQLWEFYRVTSTDKKDALTVACLGQSAARTAREMVVFVTRQDKWKQHAEWNLKTTQQALKGQEDSRRYKQVSQYYGKLMGVIYRNDFLGIATLIRKTVVFGISLAGKPITRLTTHADQRVVCHKSCALAAQTFMLSMTEQGFDTCPMEGFDEKRVKKILNLPYAAEVCMIIACGKGKPEGQYGERFRVANESVIFEV